MRGLHGILLACRHDTDMKGLTASRTNGSLPFGGRYRAIDFMLSNLVNAGVTDVGVVVEEGYQSLLDHLGSGKDWDLSRREGGLRLLPPYACMQKGAGPAGRPWGTMEALRGVYGYLSAIRRDYVLLAAGDMAVNLDLGAAFRQHLDSGADVTAVCAPPGGGEGENGLFLRPGADGWVHGAADRPEEGLESLDIYILSKELLLALVRRGAARGSYDLAGAILTELGPRGRIRPWVFDGYCAKLRSAAAYFAHSMELLDPAVRRALFDPRRPIRTRDRSTPATYYAPGARCRNSLVADGCIIEGTVENSVLFRGVRVEKDAVVQNAVLMQGTAVGCGGRVKNVVADKHVTVGPGSLLYGHEKYPLVIEKNAVL